MNSYQILYEANKKVDEYFHSNSLLSDTDMYKNDCLELIVEFCELANETKCFKYWLSKNIKMEDLMFEYSDCVLMVLSFYNKFSIKNVEIIDLEIKDDIVLAFINVINMCSLLLSNPDSLLIKKIFTYLLYIGNLLSLEEKDIIDTCYKKIDKIMSGN